jgi:phosphatidylglycerol:prolipoprotein diacylglycerol transferase
MSLLNVLTYITWDIDPDIFTIPFINHPVRWYGLLFAFAFLISQQIMYFIYKRDGLPATEVDTLTVYAVVATIVGVRLGHVLFYDPIHYFQNPIKILMVWEGGLASHGGVIGILVAIYLFARKTNANYLWVLDRVSIVASLTFCIIRLGNLMNSEMIGTPTNLPWAFIFTRVDDVPRHPAQLYEAIHYFIWFIVLFLVWYRLKDRMKIRLLFSWSLIILFSLRFVDEFFKLDQVDFEGSMILNMGQLLSIPFILTGVLLLIFKVYNNQGTVPADKISVDGDRIGVE